MLASELEHAVARRIARLANPPRLVVVRDGRRDDPVGARYIRRKLSCAQRVGVEAREVRVPEDAPDLPTAVHRALREGAQVVVQLPVSQAEERDEVFALLPPQQDPDVLGVEARRRFVSGNAPVLPPVVGAVASLLARYGIEVGPHTVVAVVGRGYLVGEPLAQWFAQQRAEVRVVEKGADLAGVVRDADIVVGGAGAPGIITADMVKEGVVVLDAGTSEVGGVLQGDVTASVAAKARLWTPVPGGIGPIAVAKLLENVAVLAEQAS